MTQQQKKTKEPDRHRPVLTPPREQIPHQATSPLVVVSIIGGFFALLLLGVIVLWLLPAKVNKIPLPHQSAQQTVQPAEPPETVKLQPDKQEAERLLGEWLKRQAIAESENISAWGREEYADILASVAQADQLFQGSMFDAAQKGYRQAIDDIESLFAGKNDRLASALEQGQLALEQQDSAAAIKAFELGLSINPDHEEALGGAERARNLEQVLTLYTESLNLERQKNLEQARQLMQKAVDIDPEFTPAAEGLQRMQNSLQDLRFQDGMSRALSALDKGNLTTADQAIAQALQEKPDDPAAKAAAQRLEEMKKGARLKELRIKAESLVGDEKWGDALIIYTKALKIDPQAGFGVIGLPEAKKRQQLDQAIKTTLLKPERLQDNGPLNDAQQLLERAKKVAAPGPVLREQIDRLDKLIIAASIPVAVTLRSDNATIVEIYHVGRFNPFYEKRLDLRPGSYIIVGKRPGYKDVRMTLKIEAGKDMPVFVFIRSEEPI
jgi:tetratricopeptide (TPR) repeat protein